MPDDFSVGVDRVSDIPRAGRVGRQDKKYESALFGDFEPNKVVDSFEAAIGLNKPEVDKKNIAFRNILLNPGGDEEDSALLNRLLNDTERYHITFMDKTWTPCGDYKMFIVYVDDLDVKAKREKLGITNE